MLDDKGAVGSMMLNALHGFTLEVESWFVKIDLSPLARV
jgi:hypothetical protein